ncbi:YggS family pyridoxal phosphate-dependent enzyme [Mucisphaera calidilacus]|uniref:Pyridoxal phosphate homeostasis protein n=1 Tax=Mucisphaera calidilacus TaxID=2527982 RepID=A0A518BUJ6_9BACT|nr:YggS family pyridoxal phosphate-dependent enzyme [Mucisphaera calidilacus]QDU70659.1 Pyridoxal phosphate homeostasis protein [Mucisphaera calidilacus]
MSTEHLVGPAEVRQSYQRVSERVANAAIRSGRRPEDVLMVAVTKNASPDQIRTLVDLGHTDLGENRVQQLTQRAAQLEEYLSRRRSLGNAVEGEAHPVPERVRWHMIGHLQRNKVKQVVPVVDLIHGVDSLRLAEELHAFGARTDQVIDILMQVNVSGEVSKHGVAAPAAIHVAEQIDTMMHLRLRGIMCMAPFTENSDETRSVFSRAASVYHDIRSERIGGNDFTVLSMGMSNDFEIAIEEGANVIRIGRALFGEADPNDDN